MRPSPRIALFASLTLLVVAGVALATNAFAAGPPAFVQQATAHKLNVASLAVTPAAVTTAGDRLVVEVGVWNVGAPTISAVTDNAGDTFVKLLSFTASDHTEMSIWTAVVATGGTKPVITATATAKADIGIVAVEYTGLSTVAGVAVLDQEAHSSGTTTAASSGASAAVGTDGGLAVGFYADSGFGTTPVAGSGFTSRAVISKVNDMDMLVEDQAVVAGAHPAATATTGAGTTWLMAVVVFKPGSGGATTPPATSSASATPTATPTLTSAPPTLTAPVAPTGVAATAADASATVAWTAPANGGSPINSYTVTPYLAGVAQPASTVAGTPPATSTIVAGLTNGSAYTFTVTATNAIGTSPASAASAPVTPTTSAPGQWSTLQNWPIVALSNSLLYNGNVVAWDGWQQPQPAVVWNPANPTTFVTKNAPTSVFCDGAATLPDGRLLVAGGFGTLTTGNLGIVDTYTFDPATSEWARMADMKKPRWYPSLTELADGRYVAISGNDTASDHWADTPEIYDPASNTWTLLSGISTPQIHETEYPFTYLVPNGKLFTIGTNEDNSFLLDANAQTWTQVGGASNIRNGSSVMYRPGKVLYSGGGVNVNASGPAAATTSVIDLTGASPQWQQIAPMNAPRVYHTLTMLPDGKVLSVGGAPNTDQHIIITGQLTTEIWDPATQTWTTGASMAVSRNYHSTALLMPDGRVLVAGGGHPFGTSDAGQFSAQYYSPSYLSSGPRPVVTSAPTSTLYGAPMTVNTPDAASISAVNLVSLGADTHQLDMNQHFVPLSFTANSSGLSIQAPASPELAPPGYYMLFLVNAQGVPSVAKMVQVRAAITAPASPGTPSAMAGNASATVSWSAPNDGGSPLTSYTVTPYVAGVAQAATTVTGNPPATLATVTGLANGISYTFKVRAANAVGTSTASAPSSAVVPTSAPPPPTFIQEGTNQGAGVSTLGVALPGTLGAGQRLVVSVGVWSQAHAVTTGVTDSAGDSFVEVGRTVAADGAEMSVWTAPVTNGVGQTPTITAQTSGAADIGVQVLDYANLSTAGDLSAVDQQHFAVGATTSAATVTSGATPAVGADGGLAVGFYADSGFNHALTGGSGWSVRSNLSPNTNMDMLGEDLVVGAAATPSAAVATGASTTWLMGTVVFKPAFVGPPALPGAPTAVTGLPMDGAATVNWTAPSNGGATITSYTVTPYVGASAQTPVTVTGSPAPSTAVISGLSNATPYTFTVTATNSVGTGPASAASAPVTPGAAPSMTFVQQVSGHGVGTSKVVTPTANTLKDHRLIVEVGVWSGSSATVTSVTDNAGDTFTKLTSFTASDHTQISVWTAVVATGGTRPAITATASGSADIGILALEYAGLSTVTGTAVVDQQSQGTGTTTSAAVVTSAATPAVTTAGSLALGFYADSGFGTALTGGSGYTVRGNMSPNGEMDLLAEESVVGVGATPAAGAGTGASTVWLLATVVFKPA